jgi:hypothetical protein
VLTYPHGSHACRANRFIVKAMERVNGKRMFRVQKAEGGDTELHDRDSVLADRVMSMKELAVGDRVAALLPKTSAIKNHPRMLHFGTVQKVESSRARVKFDSFPASWRKGSDIRLA